MKEFKVLTSALFVLILMACGDKRTDERIVSVTIEPQRYFAEKIAGDKFKINCVVPAGQSPETYDPTPQQMVQVGKSQGYLRIGSIGFEQAWMDNIRNNNPGLKVFDLSEGIDLLKRQTSPHAHYVGITPDHKYLYSVDLGADKIIMYEFINEKLQETSLSQSVIPGSGPRHMIFSHDGKYCYLVNEIANSIMVYQYEDGHFTLIQVIHCVPRHFHGFSSAAAIHMTSSGKHIIVSNRGHDSIVLYRVNQETGKITLLYMVHTGKGPRDFNIIDDRYIVVASQEDDRLELYTFDEEKEEIKPTGNTLDIIQPVCVAL